MTLKLIRTVAKCRTDSVHFSEQVQEFVVVVGCMSDSESDDPMAGGSGCEVSQPGPAGSAWPAAGQSNKINKWKSGKH